MTAHYPKLRIPTASVTATLLETVAPPGRWRGRGREMWDRKQQASDPRESQPHRPWPRLWLSTGDAAGGRRRWCLGPTPGAHLPWTPAARQEHGNQRGLLCPRKWPGSPLLDITWQRAFTDLKFNKMSLSSFCPLKEEKITFKNYHAIFSILKWLKV